MNEKRGGSGARGVGGNAPTAFKRQRAAGPGSEQRTEEKLVIAMACQPRRILPSPPSPGWSGRVCVNLSELAT